MTSSCISRLIRWLTIYESCLVCVRARIQPVPDLDKHFTILVKDEQKHAVAACMFQRRFRFRVCAAFFAEAECELADRRPAARFACRDSAGGEAERRLSRFNAPRTARERVGDGFRRWLPLTRSRLAWVLVCALPRLSGGNLTPAPRAFDRPMAMACWTERAPCFPSRICSISSRTNSPAWVEGDSPSRSSSRARSIVVRSGIARLSSFEFRRSAQFWMCKTVGPRARVPG